LQIADWLIRVGDQAATSGLNTFGAATVFKIGIDGTGLSLLHSFTGGPSDGYGPNGSLIQSGSILYGMTQSGGSHSEGTIFKINTDGTGFRLLYSFAGTAGDGAGPSGSLTKSGSTLYGMTEAGGSYAHGTIFQINTDDTSYRILHSFANTASDGGLPQGSLIRSGPTLYGMTSSGGSNGDGTIFSLVVPEPSAMTLAALAMIGLFVFRRQFCA
jgi:uncharacterized repeat protein (TIGR03803 family)